MTVDRRYRARLTPLLHTQSSAHRVVISVQL